MIWFWAGLEMICKKRSSDWFWLDWIGFYNSHHPISYVFYKAYLASFPSFPSPFPYCPCMSSSMYVLYYILYILQPHNSPLLLFPHHSTPLIITNLPFHPNFSIHPTMKKRCCFINSLIHSFTFLPPPKHTPTHYYVCMSCMFL